MLEKCISECRKVIEIIKKRKKKHLHDGLCQCVCSRLALPSTTQHPTSGIILARPPHLPPTLCRENSDPCMAGGTVGPWDPQKGVSTNTAWLSLARVGPLGHCNLDILFWDRGRGEKKKAKSLFWTSFSKICSPTEMKAWKKEGYGEENFCYTRVTEKLKH